MTRQDRRVALLLAIAASSLLLLIGQGSITSSDGYEVFQVTRSLVERGEISIETGVAVGQDGLFYSRYGPGLSALGVVPYVLAQPFSSFGPPELVERAAVASLMPIVGGLLVAMLFVLARRLGASRGAALLVAVGSVAGTYMLPYTKDFFSEPLVTLLLVVSLERAIAKRPAQAGLALAAAILVRPVAAVYAPVLLLVLAKERPAAAVRAGLAILPALALTLAWNQLRFGSLLEFGYPDHERFIGPSGDHAAKLFWHPEKSVLLFAPAVLVLPAAMLATWRRNRSAAILLAGILLATTLVVVSWWSGWRGGWSWGPRLMLPGVIVALVALAVWIDGRVGRTRVVTALFAAGLLVSAAATLVPVQTQQLDGGRTAPGIVRQVELIGPTYRTTADNLTDDALAIGDHRRFASLWQANIAREQGGSGLLAAALVSLLLLAVAFWAALQLVRALTEPRQARQPERRDEAVDLVPV